MAGDDRDAVTMLQAFWLGRKISERFSTEDTWPNTDGTFELVPSPEVSRRPKRSFVVQSKGTSTPQISLDGAVHYRLRDLAFPAYVALEVTLDPGILFLVLNTGSEGRSAYSGSTFPPGFSRRSILARTPR